jgi:hypothetical protein
VPLDRLDKLGQARDSLVDPEKCIGMTIEDMKLQLFAFIVGSIGVAGRN